jgi:hypothetical protein
LGLIAVMLPPGGACENALPKGAATIVLIDITSSNANADTTVAFMLTFSLRDCNSYNGYILKDDLQSWLTL